MAISEATIAKFDRLVARCHKAGVASAKKAKRVIMAREADIIVDSARKVKYKMYGYPFGFVNLQVSNGRCGFAQYLKFKGGLGYNNSIHLYHLEVGTLNTEFGALCQSMELQEAYWEAWSHILESKDIKTYISSRID
jgi:hypothetical protein